MSTIPETKPWQVTSKKVDAVIHKIIEVANPLKVILFGSYIDGYVDQNSDLDIMIITQDDVENPRKESVRIRRQLRGISMPMDILVVPQQQWNQLKNQPGQVYREAETKGKVVYERPPA
jgi:predicted nucleotidyltransferase